MTSTSALLAAGLALALPAPPVVAAPPGGTGQFKVNCRWAGTANDDPIGMPRKPGLSHAHRFFGHPSIRADSTAESLLASPGGCHRPGDRSSYWTPAVLTQSWREDGALDQADNEHFAHIYYRTAMRDPRSIRPLPLGLRMIAGDQGARRNQSVRVVHWRCTTGYAGPGSPRPVDCNPDGVPKLVVRFPDCWDGRRLDSPDHQSHMAYAVRARGRYHRRCPATHPVAVPKVSFTIIFFFSPDRAYRLSSGPITTAHADFLNAWDPAALEEVVARCLRADITCGED